MCNSVGDGEMPPTASLHNAHSTPHPCNIPLFSPPVPQLSQSHLLLAIPAPGFLPPCWPHHSSPIVVSVKEKLTADPDSEVATTSLRVSLMCPVGTREGESEGGRANPLDLGVSDCRTPLLSAREDASDCSLSGPHLRPPAELRCCPLSADE